MPQAINISGKEVPVEQLRDDWALALMSQGIIVRLRISKWSAMAILSSEDLGLKFVDDETAATTKKYITLGQQKLMPPKFIKNIETTYKQAKGILEFYSFDTVWGRFVPYTAFDEWEKENARHKEIYLAQVKALGGRYEEMIATVKQDYKIIARDVWARLYPESKSDPTNSFMEDFAAKVIAKIPPVEKLVSSFKYDMAYFVIPMPSFLEENIAKAEQIRLQTEADKFNADLAKQTKKRIADEYMLRKKELIDGFLQATVVNMRQYVAELCNTILQSMGQKKAVGKVTIRDINKMKDMIQKVKLLNFYNDKEITSLLKELWNEVSKFDIKGEMKDDIVEDKLKAIIAVAKEEFMPKDFNPAISTLDV